MRLGNESTSRLLAPVTQIVHVCLHAFVSALQLKKYVAVIHGGGFSLFEREREFYLLNSPVFINRSLPNYLGSCLDFEIFC